ncbi:catalase [Silvimonas terrae]|uniref:Catalase n=1 Tax=Silvimonas terrae TaxID=300266 RepID=A0A840RHK4_9NEIS|nr:catalase [Silvimonas terrae]MBB5191753.1 catalase [Silvimonas terrae]
MHTKFKKPLGPNKGQRPIAGNGAPNKTDVTTAERQQRLNTQAEQVQAAQTLAEGMPFNSTKECEYGELALRPAEGAHLPPPSWPGTASTISEITPSAKAGAGQPLAGASPASESLDRARTDATGQRLTTNQGVPIADNQNSLKAGLRGPTAMEDFILREKITHFDHERIPERVVHARGSGAHGYFESLVDLSEHTRATPFAQPGKITPVFVRFSTVAGERGSADTVRDVRGFAVKFYTDEGNWDLVGNNIPVFFIQDAMKFPDLIHAVKPEPNNGIPQAASAHDTFWDFASLSPEATHMLLWHTSDRAIPRSYRMMQGFGVHTFRLVNAEGVSVFCKFHWTPVDGTHSLVWDEATRLAGADPDFHRRDLWEAIEAGEFPEWELGLQIFDEELADSFPFDVLDPTKLVPEELVPLTPVGRMVLNRNPDNFFAETEQVAFCTAHVVPGIDFSNDPLLQGRIHSYLDTQISRLGGANFHELPINAPLAPLHNNQRDGIHRQAIPRGRVAYEPNSLGGGCPFQAGMAGFTSFAEHIAADKVRGKPEKFADHYSQARLFWQSQTPPEQQHIIDAFRFELAHVQTPAIRQRVVSMLVNVDARLAAQVAVGLGFEVPLAMPAVGPAPDVQYDPSPGLSLLSRLGEKGIRTRKIAILADADSPPDKVNLMRDTLREQGANVKVIAARLQVISADGESLAVDIPLSASPSVLFDAVIVADGVTIEQELDHNGLALEFLKLQYRHGKPLLMTGRAQDLLPAAGIPAALPDGSPDPALFLVGGDDPAADLAPFIKALSGQRVYARETDPPTP